MVDDESYVVYMGESGVELTVSSLDIGLFERVVKAHPDVESGMKRKLIKDFKSAVLNGRFKFKGQDVSVSGRGA
jgi:hypothetical protein